MPVNAKTFSVFISAEYEGDDEPREPRVAVRTGRRGSSHAATRRFPLGPLTGRRPQRAARRLDASGVVAELALLSKAPSPSPGQGAT
jgi:hypothetical protein